MSVISMMTEIMAKDLSEQILIDLGGVLDHHYKAYKFLIHDENNWPTESSLLVDPDLFIVYISIKNTGNISRIRRFQSTAELLQLLIALNCMRSNDE